MAHVLDFLAPATNSKEGLEAVGLASRTAVALTLKGAGLFLAQARDGVNSGRSEVDPLWGSDA